MASFSFDGFDFDMVVPGSGETPHIKVVVEATDRKLIGTSRFERSIRSRMLVVEGELLIEPADNAVTTFVGLQYRYREAIQGVLKLADLTETTGIILTFEVAPIRGGLDGYRGKVVFGLPAGIL